MVNISLIFSVYIQLFMLSLPRFIIEYLLTKNVYIRGNSLEIVYILESILRLHCLEGNFWNRGTIFLSLCSVRDITFIITFAPYIN